MKIQIGKKSKFEKLDPFCCDKILKNVSSLDIVGYLPLTAGGEPVRRRVRDSQGTGDVCSVQRRAPPHPAAARRAELMRKYRLKEPSEELIEKVLADYLQV
jgi:hypothetical protein